MEFFLNELLQYCVLACFYRALFYGECLKEYEKAEVFIQMAYNHGLKLLEGCYATNFSNMVKIRLYYAKLKLMQADWKSAKELLIDNVKDSQIELSLRKSKNPSANNDPKVQKCVQSDD